jgi:ketosteroid isomerase-like protein
MAKDFTKIREFLQDHARAIGAKDAERTLAAYAPDAVTYDLAPPLANSGAQLRDRAGLEAWFATWRGPIGYELRDFSIVPSGDLAVCHGLLRMSGTKTNGEITDVWCRRTVCLRRDGEAWRIMHEHVSVPFYMDGSLKAAVDLRP